MKTQNLKHYQLCLWLFAFSFLLTTGMKCKKESNLDADGLPKATQTGRNIFACKVNGENWISSPGIYNLNGGIENDSLFVIGSPDHQGYFESLTLKIYKIELNQSLNIENAEIGKITYSTNKTCIGYTGALTIHQKAVTGSINLTKADQIKKIISGSFECKIPIENCDTLHVTDGRFDIKY